MLINKIINKIIAFFAREKQKNKQISLFKIEFKDTTLINDIN